MLRTTPPMPSLSFTESAAGRNSFLSLRQPALLAVPLLINEVLNAKNNIDSYTIPRINKRISCKAPPPPSMASLSFTESAAGRNSFLSLRQPAHLAVPLLIARLAVVAQCVTVYPVLVYAIRSQFFTALIYFRCARICIKTSVTWGLSQASNSCGSR